MLFLIISVKLHAFIALVLVSVLTARAVNVPLSDIPDVLLFGFAGTLGEVALLVGFGVMIGRFGEKRAPLALGGPSDRYRGGGYGALARA